MSKKKTDILKTAMRLFAHKGFRQTSMAELSRLSEAAEGTIFYYFKTKDNLLVAVLENARNAIIDAFRNSVRDKTALSGIDRVEALLTFYLHQTEQMQEEFLILHRHFPYEKAEADALWPATPERLAAYDAWLADADALVAGLEPSTDEADAGHRQQLVELRKRALPRTPEQREAERESHPSFGAWESQRAELEAADLMMRKAARLYDAGEPCGIEANAAKLLGARAGFTACERAVLTHGGYGYAAEYHVERYMREIWINRLAPISEQLVLSFIAERALGLPKSY